MEMLFHPCYTFDLWYITRMGFDRARQWNLIGKGSNKFVQQEHDVVVRTKWCVISDVGLKTAS